MKENKEGFSIERVCAMCMFNLAFLCMAFMLCAFLSMFQANLNDMAMALTYGAFTLFCGIYCYCHIFKFRKLISLYVKDTIKEEISEIMSNTNISDRLETKVEKAVTDRIEKSEVIRLDDVPNPEIVHPSKTANA